MKSQEVVQKLRFFNDARKSIRVDTNLSDTGKARAAQNLEQSIELFRGSALAELAGQWRGVRERYTRLDERRLKAEQAEGSRWNYQALNYESQAVKARLEGMYDKKEVTSYLEDVMNSGNVEKKRAMAETAPGVLRRKFPGLEGERLVVKLENQLNQLVDTPELQAVRDEGSELAQDVVNLWNATNETSRFYSKAGDGSFGYKDEFERLLEGVSIFRKLDVETLGETYTVEFREPATQAEGALVDVMS